MKIFVNARLLNKPYTGIAQFTKNIFFNLSKSDSKNEYVLVLAEKTDLTSWGELPKNLKIKLVKEPSFLGKSMAKTIWEQFLFPRFAAKEKASAVFHPYPANSWLLSSKTPEIVTVHDCIPWVNSNYRKGVLSKLYHFMTKKALKKAKKLITVSETSKKEIIEICGIEAHKITVVSNDAAAAYKQKAKTEFELKVLEEFSLKKNSYFLYVGGYDERKNVSFMLKEYSSIKSSKHPMVLTGGKQFDSPLYESLDFESQEVLKTGFIEEAKLAALYRNCLAYVNFSKHEGFNIPILEAANCGAPLILSEIPVHKEVAGDAAAFVDIEKNGEGSIAMKKTINHEIREKWSRKSLALAEKYSIKDSVETIKELITEEL
jgi:glycosyltransferase involved in cell wall biosynthesis